MAIAIRLLVFSIIIYLSFTVPLIGILIVFFSVVIAVWLGTMIGQPESTRKTNWREW
jgi:hypothetical protein